MRLIIEYSCTFVRIDLATKNLYPSTNAMLRMVNSSFKRGISKVYKDGDKGMFEHRVFLL